MSSFVLENQGSMCGGVRGRSGRSEIVKEGRVRKDTAGDFDLGILNKTWPYFNI